MSDPTPTPLTSAERVALRSVCWLEVEETPDREWAMYLDDAIPVVERIVAARVAAARADERERVVAVLVDVSARSSSHCGVVFDRIRAALAEPDEVTA